MGLSLRILLINDDDSIRRLPLTRYERLVGRDPNERLPEYAGKRVRYAEVIVEFHERKPVQILKTQYFMMSFDSEGKMDLAERERESRLAMDVLSPHGVDEEDGTVVNARHLFAKRRYDNEYRWTPSPEMEKEIVRATFGKD